jgi:hypothetical protein
VGVVYNMFIYARTHTHTHTLLHTHTHTHVNVHHTNTHTHTQVCETARRAWDFKETRVDDITCLLVFLPPQRAPHPPVPHPVPQTYPQYVPVQSDANYGGEGGEGGEGGGRGGYTQAPHYTSLELDPRPAGAYSQMLSSIGPCVWRM